ncbi:MAG: hypothetical protein CBB90_00790 [Gammaproteobacteria bacterium TMED30]|nr:MAG: hypothetical protein CBB90_00790 [Gammaproteobacteria bacterium TMED30]
MLSRVAEKLYWLARYLERAENTARLISIYNHLIMDIPKGSEPSWMILIDILDAREQFEYRYNSETEQNIHRFLIERSEEQCSVPYSILQAYENVRTTRDTLPQEAWEYISELRLYVIQYSKQSLARSKRLAFLDEIVQRCQMLTGLFHSSLSRDEVYSFLRIGKLVERADMGIRITDVGAQDIMDREGAFKSIDQLLWGALLEALSAKSAYRRMKGPVVDKEDVIELIFQAERFPRSLTYCLRELRVELMRLPNSEASLKKAHKILRILKSYDSRQEVYLHEYNTNLQKLLRELGVSFSKTWFQRDGL